MCMCYGRHLHIFIDRFKTNSFLGHLASLSPRRLDPGGRRLVVRDRPAFDASWSADARYTQDRSKHDLLRLVALRGGSGRREETLDFCNTLTSFVLADTVQKVSELRKSFHGKPIPGFGAKIDELVEHALETFDRDAARNMSKRLHNAKRNELQLSCLSIVKPIFSQQIHLLMDSTMEQFKLNLFNASMSRDDALQHAETSFVREANASVPSRTHWNFELDYECLVGAMQAVLSAELSGVIVSEGRFERMPWLRDSLWKNLKACMHWAIIALTLHDTDVVESVRTDTWKTLRMRPPRPIGTRDKIFRRRQQVAKVGSFLGVGYTPRVIFLTGLMLRSLQMSTKIRDVLDPSAGHGAGALLAASYAQREWLPCFMFGWGVGGAYWSAFSVRPPSV